MSLIIGTFTGIYNGIAKTANHGYNWPTKKINNAANAVFGYWQITSTSSDQDSALKKTGKHFLNLCFHYPTWPIGKLVGFIEANPKVSIAAGAALIYHVATGVCCPLVKAIEVFTLATIAVGVRNKQY